MCSLCIGVPYLSIVTEDVTDMGPTGERQQKWVGVSRHGGPGGYGLTPRRLPAARADVLRSTWTQSEAELDGAKLEMRKKEAVMLRTSSSVLIPRCARALRCWTCRSHNKRQGSASKWVKALFNV